jgi:magnesium and cobalt transporter
MGSELSDEWGETIGGLILHHYGELPPKGADIDVEGFRFVILAVEENRIQTLEFEKSPDEEASEGASAIPETESPEDHDPN